MNTTFQIEGYFLEGKPINLNDIPLVINIPDWIEERNVYKTDTFEQFAAIKPKKYGGLSYRIIDIKYDYALIKTSSYGECYVVISKETPITNYPMYERGEY